MKALLLNSGVGSRMGSLTENKAKCMCPIGNGYTIIGWQLELMRRSGIREIVVTTGPFEDLLEKHAALYGEGLDITFVNNPLYKETNYIYSMYLAKDYLEDDILLFHGDLVFEPSVVKDMLSADCSVVTVDRLLPLPEKDFKARIENGKIKAIGVNFFGSDCVACQPAYKMNKPDFALWMGEIEAFCRRGDTKVYAENALNNVSGKLALYPLELERRLCNEIDNLDDLEAVSERFVRLFRSKSI
ncbi:MAG: NTP transferase domain-containing protein [Caulobacteraceae bacterium]